MKTKEPKPLVDHSRPGPKTLHSVGVIRLNVTLDPASIEFYRQQSPNGDNLSEGIRVFWRQFVHDSRG